MGSESLRPLETLSSGAWTNESSGAATVASIDEPVLAHDGDLSYITLIGSSSVFSCKLSHPLGTADTSTGIASWALRLYAKRVGTVPEFIVTLLQGSETITEVEPSLQASYAQTTLLFDPAQITDCTDLRLHFTATGDASNYVRVTAADLRIVVRESSLTNSRTRGQIA